MSLSLTFFWVLIVSAMSILGALYARKYQRPSGLIALYITMVIFSTLAASKSIIFDFPFGQFFAPATVLTFAVTFLLTDIVNEKFGRKETQRMILLAFVSQGILMVFSYIVLNAKGAPFFENQEAFEVLFGSVPRIAIASLVAFYVSENFDAWVYSWFRKLTRGKHLWARNAFSSIPSMFLDSVLFMTIAFYGVFPIIPTIIGLVVVKWVVGVVDIPFMYISRAILGKPTAEVELELSK